MAFEVVLDQRKMSSNFIKASVVSEFCGRRDKLPSRINGVGEFLNTLSSRGLSRIEDLGQDIIESTGLVFVEFMSGFLHCSINKLLLGSLGQNHPSCTVSTSNLDFLNAGLKKFGIRDSGTKFGRGSRHID